MTKLLLSFFSVITFITLAEFTLNQHSDYRNNSLLQLKLVHIVSTRFLNSYNLLMFPSLLKLFRHGERTPSSTYPKDPHRNENYEPFGKGELTNVSFQI